MVGPEGMALSCVRRVFFSPVTSLVTVPSLAELKKYLDNALRSMAIFLGLFLAEPGPGIDGPYGFLSTWHKNPLLLFVTVVLNAKYKKLHIFKGD